MGLIACEACGQQVSEAATACPKCGHPTERGKGATKPNEVAAIVMLLLPLLGVAWIYVRIDGMRLIERPDNALAAVVALVIGGTALLAAIDNSMLQKSYKRIAPTNGPVQWFFFMLLLWVVAFPAYFIGRGKTGANSYVTGGIVVALLFTVVAGWYGYMIEESMSELRRRLESLGQ